MAIKENTKKKQNIKRVKNAPKTTLDSVFVENPPQFSPEFDSKVKDMLERSLALISPSLLQRNGNDMPETPSKQKKIKLTDAASRNLTFGFNAVMRGLEKGQIKCIFLKALAKPNFLAESFVHVCRLKAIPLITVKGLSTMIKKNFGIKSTLVLGFKSPACEEGSPFHDLYVTCCDTLDVEPLEDSEPSKTAVQLCKILESSKSKKKTVGSYHLTIKDKSERVFKPAKGLSLRIFHDPLTLNSSKAQTLDIDSIKDALLPETSGPTPTQNDVDVPDFMFIDDEGVFDDHPGKTLDVATNDYPEETLNVARSDHPGETLDVARSDHPGETLDGARSDHPGETLDVTRNDNPFKRKGKKRPANDFVYVETKLKRIKGNPNRRK